MGETTWRDENIEHIMSLEVEEPQEVGVGKVACSATAIK